MAKLHNNKTCHRDRIACLTAHHVKNFNVKLKHFANAEAAAYADGSIIALPGLCPGELKALFSLHCKGQTDLVLELHFMATFC